MVDRQRVTDSRNAYLEWVKAHPKTVSIIMAVEAVIIILQWFHKI